MMGERAGCQERKGGSSEIQVSEQIQCHLSLALEWRLSLLLRVVVDLLLVLKLFNYC